MENISREVGQANTAMKLMKSEQKADNESIRKAFNDRSQDLEEKVNSNFSQLENEVIALKSEIKECSRQCSNNVSKLKKKVSAASQRLSHP